MITQVSESKREVPLYKMGFMIKVESFWILRDLIEQLHKTKGPEALQKFAKWCAHRAKGYAEKDPSKASTAFRAQYWSDWQPNTVFVSPNDKEIQVRVERASFCATEAAPEAETERQEHIAHLRKILGKKTCNLKSE